NADAGARTGRARGLPPPVLVPGPPSPDALGAAVPPLVEAADAPRALRDARRRLPGRGLARRRAPDRPAAAGPPRPRGFRALALRPGAPARCATAGVARRRHALPLLQRRGQSPRAALPLGRDRRSRLGDRQPGGARRRSDRPRGDLAR